MNLLLKVTMTAHDPVKWVISATFDASPPRFFREHVIVIVDSEQEALSIAGQIIAVVARTARPATDSEKAAFRTISEFVAPPAYQRAETRCANDNHPQGRLDVQLLGSHLPFEQESQS